MRELILDYLSNLLRIASPSGYGKDAIVYLLSTLIDLGYDDITTENSQRPNVLRVRVTGQAEGPHLTWMSHVDTLGVEVVQMVLTEDVLQLPYPGHVMPGTFCKVSLIGGVDPWAMLNQEVVFLPKGDGPYITGTILRHSRGRHVGPNGPNITSYFDPLEHDEDKKQVYLLCRLDQAVELLPGQPGAIYTPLMQMNNGLLKSRYLDSKADVAVMLAVLAEWKRTGYVPPHTVDFMFNTREEIGIPMRPDYRTTDCVALEFIPSELGCPLDHVGLVGSDLAGPTDESLNTLLAEACRPWQTEVKRYHIPRFYSDASLTKALKDPPMYRHATLGFGMDQSHGNERTHEDGLVKMAQLVSCFHLPV